jgi:hypothetical protein
VIGGLLGVAMTAVGLGWQAKLAFIAIPGILVAVLCIGVRFPPTERAAGGVSMGQMFRELANPLFIILFLSMFLTAASELAPGQWVDFALSRTVHMPGILLLVYVSALMFVARHFAGPLVEKLSSIGLLWVSCLMASLGLVALSMANSPITGLLAATAVGRRCLLHVADDARDRLGTIPARRCAADGTHGDSGNAVDSIRPSLHGRHLRPHEDCRRWRGSRVQRARASE